MVYYGIVVNLRFLHTGKEFTKWKKLKGRECGKASAREKTVNTPQDTRRRMIPAEKSILTPYRKLATGLPMKRFSMHALRHTYATRAIERGVMPKVLQKLLGHSSIKTTIDRYVHVTDASLTIAVQQFEQATVLAG